jgi:DNA gyrase/topoisomerase IV subunit B
VIGGVTEACLSAGWELYSRIFDTVVPVSSAEAAERVFELLMGSDVAPRKEFIVAGAQTLDHSRIDV